MKNILKKIANRIDDSILRWWVKWLYPQYHRPRKGYTKNYVILSHYFFWQKILRINGNIPWPVNFRSRVLGVEFIEKGICCDPGDNMGIYINAYGGLKMGNNVNIGQNTTINTTNHYKYDHRKLSHTKGVEIGDNVWIGSNCSIVPGTQIGSNVTIGAGCYIKGKIPDDCTVISESSSLKIIAKTKAYEWDCTKEELN